MRIEQTPKNAMEWPAGIPYSLMHSEALKKPIPVFFGSSTEVSELNQAAREGRLHKPPEPPAVISYDEYRCLPSSDRERLRIAARAGGLLLDHEGLTELETKAINRYALNDLLATVEVVGDLQENN